MKVITKTIMLALCLTAFRTSSTEPCRAALDFTAAATLATVPNITFYSTDLLIRLCIFGNDADVIDTAGMTLRISDDRVRAFRGFLLNHIKSAQPLQINPNDSRQILKLKAAILAVRGGLQRLFEGRRSTLNREHQMDYIYGMLLTMQPQDLDQIAHKQGIDSKMARAHLRRLQSYLSQDSLHALGHLRRTFGSN